MELVAHVELVVELVHVHVWHVEQVQRVELVEHVELVELVWLAGPACHVEPL